MIRFYVIAVLFLLSVENVSSQLVVESTAFAKGHYIPYRYTCDGENINPALRIKNIPASAKSLALIMMDSTAAFGVFDHWIVWNILPVELITENSQPGITGLNSNKQNKYYGPCPPNSIHEYYFRVYALDVILNLPVGSTKQTLLSEVQKHLVAKGELVALFQRE